MLLKFEKGTRHPQPWDTNVEKWKVYHGLTVSTNQSKQQKMHWWYRSTQSYITKNMSWIWLYHAMMISIQTDIQTKLLGWVPEHCKPLMMRHSSGQWTKTSWAFDTCHYGTTQGFRDIGHMGVQAHVKSIHVSPASWSFKSLMAALGYPQACMDHV